MGHRLKVIRIQVNRLAITIQQIADSPGGIVKQPEQKIGVRGRTPPTEVLLAHCDPRPFPPPRIRQRSRRGQQIAAVVTVIAQEVFGLPLGERK